MLSLYLGVLAGTGQVLLGLAALGLVFVLSLGSLGMRKAMAFFGLTDLLLLLPVLLGVLMAQGEPPSVVLAHHRWRVVSYTLGFGLGLALFRGRSIPECLLPMRGQWARKLLALTAVSLPALGGIGDALWGIGMMSVEAVLGSSASSPAGGQWLFAPRWTHLLPPLLFPYFWSAWDVLTRGWEPEPAAA